MNFFSIINDVFGRKQNRHLQLSHLYGWRSGLVTAARPSSHGTACQDCKYFDAIPALKKGICRKYSGDKLLLRVAARDERTCLEVEIKRVHCCHLARIKNEMERHRKNRYNVMQIAQMPTR